MIQTKIFRTHKSVHNPLFIICHQINESFVLELNHLLI